MKRLILFVLLLLPIPAFATVKTYTRGYTDMWCDATNCYLTAVTNYSNSMMAHQTAVVASLKSPSGQTAYRRVNLTTGQAKASVFIPHQNYLWKGDWQATGETGEVFCPKGQMTFTAQYYSRGKKLGSSIICTERGPIWSACTPGYFMGIQTGWTCTYFPLETCNVKCQASLYAVWVVGGAGTTPAPRGEFVKGWELDVETAKLTCHPGFIMQFYPNPCLSCKEKVIGTAPTI